MSGRVPGSSASRRQPSPPGRRLVVKIARAVTYQWLSGHDRCGPVLSAPDTLAMFGSNSEHFATTPSRANGLCGRLRAEIDAELKTISDRILTLIGGLSK
jgi:hypothetical protein